MEEIKNFPTLYLNRFCDCVMGVFGELELPNDVSLCTVERPWFNNRPNISCIPTGTYLCKPRRYFRGNYDTFEITAVKDRKYILFHKGNTQQDVRGCIALGTSLGAIHGSWAVINSAIAFKEFIEVMTGFKEFKLIISNNGS